MNIKISIISLSLIMVLSSCNGAANVKSAVNTDIDSLCFDPSAQYHFVKGLIGSRQYNSQRKFYSPVKAKNGVIKHDFNDDNRVDYVFLERKPSEPKARLMLCLSHGKSGYTRKKTAFVAREFKTMDNYVESTAIARKGDSLLISDSSHAHNDGSENRSSLFTFNPKRQAFTLRKYEYFSYGQAFPEIAQTFDLQKQRYVEEKGCTFAGDSASIAFEPNCKPRKISQCLRSDGVIYISSRPNRNVLRKRVVACQ